MFGSLGYWAAMAVCLLISGFASSRVRGTFARYDRVRTRSSMTGYDTAVRLLRRGHAPEIGVGRTGGELTDHYHPAKNVVNLSDSTYGSASVAAVAVAAHEIGHVMQMKEGYGPYRVRTAIVPAVNLGSRLAMPLVLVGLLLETGRFAAGNSNLGYGLAVTGVALYSLSLVFALVTLPVEYNASRRAKEMLLEEGILSEDELPGADAVLSAAAMTYVASMLVSLVYLLRFAWMVLSVFGRGSRRR